MSFIPISKKKQSLESDSTMALSATASAASSDAMQTRGGSALKNVDVPLMLYFLFWYIGNYYYNIVSTYIRQQLIMGLFQDNKYVVSAVDHYLYSPVNNDKILNLCLKTTDQQVGT